MKFLMKKKDNKTVGTKGSAICTKWGCMMFWAVIDA